MRGDSTMGPWPSVWPGSSCRHACAPWQGPNSIPYPEELLGSGYCTAFCGQKVESVRSQRKHCRSKRNIIKWMHNSTMTIGQSNQKNPNGNHLKKMKSQGCPKKTCWNYWLLPMLANLSFGDPTDQVGTLLHLCHFDARWHPQLASLLDLQRNPAFLKHLRARSLVLDGDMGTRLSRLLGSKA